MQLKIEQYKMYLLIYSYVWISQVEIPLRWQYAMQYKIGAGMCRADMEIQAKSTS